MKGFILGKFLPLHKGHLELIKFARQHCDFLYVIICCEDNEVYNKEIRMSWLEKELETQPNIEIIGFTYSEELLPNTSRSSRDVSAKWAEVLKKIVPDAAIVFTSEPYGDYLAEYMGIQHLLFDINRTHFPVSATQIREDPFKFWNFLAEATRPWFVKKVAIVGSESTGKSTLAKKLADYFNTDFVSEAGRDVVSISSECSFDQLETIAVLHAKKINEACLTANKLLFLDTDINITISYGLFLFNRKLEVDPWIEEANKSDLYLFLETDCPFIQDGTRLEFADRNKLSDYHKKQLKQAKIDFIPVFGNWKERFASAVKIIERKFFHANG